MQQSTAFHRQSGETDESYEAPLLPLSDLTRRVVSKVQPAQTSQSIEPEQTSAVHSQLLGDVLLLRPEVSDAPAGRFEVLQQYEGVVLSIDEESFWARLINKTRPAEPDEEAEFPLEEVSTNDRHLLEQGAVFYWHIGYYDSLSGQRTRQSVIRFRRLPRVVQEDLQAARREAPGQVRVRLDSSGSGGRVDLFGSALRL